MKDPTIRHTWAKRVERWKDSGLSAKAFAAELGINARSLTWWRWQLSKVEGPETPTTEPRRRQRRSRGSTLAITKPTALSPMTFVEMTAPTISDALEVILPSTMRVCVRPGFDDATLGRLLDVLERRR
jgi:transposase